MKRYALPFCAALSISMSASLGLAQVKSVAPVPATKTAPGKASADPADPQRPDGAPAVKHQDAPQPQDAPQSAALPDPQRPDEHQPPKGSQNPNVPQEIHLTLTPAAEPVPALKYELLPPPPQRTPGNGATNYYRAFLHVQQVANAIPKEEREKVFQDYDNWFDKSLQEMPKEAMEKWVGYHRSAVWEMKAATYREECHFNLRVQDLRGLDTINFLLHDFQSSRDLGRVLKVKARLEVASGKLDDALETVRQGLQLGRDTAEPELLINGLIGIAICNIMQDELVEIIDQPGSPNLYWALSSLPRPLVDLRRGIRFEMDMPERMFPFLKDAETAQRTPEEWQKLMVESLGQIQEVAGPTTRLPEWQSRLVATAGLMMIYPEAKKRLLEDGFDRQQLEKMPVAQVVAIQTSRAQKRVYHNVFKWASLPYSQQGTRADESMKKMIAEMGGPGQVTAADPLFLARLLLPAVNSAMYAEIRLHSNFAGLQTIEALRLHAAANGGRLPKTLEEVTIVPIPFNPATEKPFPYEFRDGIATLTVPAPQGQIAGAGKKYVIRMEAR
jgi:hypothetical protein